MDYSRLIPETAPEDLFACIEKECERFRKADCFTHWPIAACICGTGMLKT